MYTSFFGLNEKPFAITPDPRYLFMSERHGEALAPEIAEVTMRSSVSTELDADGASSMIKLLEMLEDLDDVQNVFSNAEIADDILAQMQ